MDGPETRTVACGHILVESLDGIRTAELTELLVHVVGAATRVVAEPNAKVLDLQGLLLLNLERHVRGTAIRPYSVCHLNGYKGKIHTTLTPMISPLAFLTFFNCLKKASALQAGARNDKGGEREARAQILA